MFKIQDAQSVFMKSGSILPLMIVGLAILTILAVAYFAFPYNPTNPPVANDTGSTPEGIAKVVNSTNNFGVNLFLKTVQMSKTAGGARNILISPYSVYSALALVYEGAQGHTKDIMQRVIGYPDKSELEPNFAALYNRLNSNNSSYVLRTGNAIWIDKSFHVRKSYISRCSEYYGAKAALLDFCNQYHKSADIINQFISEQTNGKIKDLVSPESVRCAKLVITNAVYFNGTWVHAFDAKKTHKAKFYVSPSKTVMADMMVLDKVKIPVAFLDQVTMFSLPYKGHLSMVVILPTNKTLDQLEQNLTYAQIKRWESKMWGEHMEEIQMPKFKFKWGADISPEISGLGLSDLFGSPDLTDMYIPSGEGPIGITSVVHKAYIDVNEKGTEAAAATEVTVGVTAVNPMYTHIIVNRPFLFLIQDDKTGAILFMGQVVDPTASV